jgi:YggT family protein
MGTLILLFRYAVTFYLLVTIMRWYLPLIRADYYNPLAQFIVRATQFPLARLRRAIPSKYGIDLACITLILMIEAVEIIVMLLLFNGSLIIPIPLLITLVVAGFVRILILFFTAIFFSLIISSVVSWITPVQNTHPGVRLIITLPTPFLSHLRKWVPPLGGIDFTPMIFALFLIYTHRAGIQLLAQLLPHVQWFFLILNPISFFK